MIVSIQDLREKAKGDVVTIPGFADGEFLEVRIKRPSLMEMVVAGKIPNPLLASASKLFKDGVNDVLKTSKNDGVEFKEFAETIHCVVKESLVEPSYEELKENEIELNDMQLLYIYNYVVDGVDRLRSFRNQ